MSTFSHENGDRAVEDPKAVAVLRKPFSTIFEIVIDRRDVGCVSYARRRTVEMLRYWGRDADTIEKAELIVSEMVGNAIKHAYGKTTLSVKCQGASLEETCISVSDQSSRQPQLRRPDEKSESGRGLELIISLSLAGSFGWERHAGGGKTIWTVL